MRGGRPVWTVPGSAAPAAGSSGPVTTSMPQLEPEDGLYYLRATSLLHHQAADVSPEFAVSGVWLSCCGGVVVEATWWREGITGARDDGGGALARRYCGCFRGVGCRAYVSHMLCR